jgi:hypothetical protein
MKFELLLIALLPLFIMYKPTNGLKNKKAPKITVYFEVDKKDIDISNSFSLEFISEGKSYLGKIKDNHLILPALPKNIKSVSVIFKYQEYELHFPKVGLDLINYRGKIDWVFRIVYPPFNEMRIKDIEINKPSKINYFGFSPDEGSGIEVIEPIYDK